MNPSTTLLCYSYVILICILLCFPVIKNWCYKKGDGSQCPINDIILHANNIHLCSPMLGILAEPLSFSILFKNEPKRKLDLHLILLSNKCSPLPVNDSIQNWNQNYSAKVTPNNCDTEGMINFKIPKTDPSQNWGVEVFNIVIKFVLLSHTD